MVRSRSIGWMMVRPLRISTVPPRYAAETVRRLAWASTVPPHGAVCTELSARSRLHGAWSERRLVGGVGSERLYVRLGRRQHLLTGHQHRQVPAHPDTPGGQRLGGHQFALGESGGILVGEGLSLIHI